MRALSILGLLIPATAAAQDFTFNPAGTLTNGSGMGDVDDTVYAPGMRFPIETPPAFANSQVWGRGGSNGPGGSQCDAQNFSYPWWDNFCETRSWDMPLCPAGVGHQGQDIRASSCQKLTHWVVAVESGTITSIGSYSVYLTIPDGTRFDYLHMGNVQVTVGQEVQKGQHIGQVSNEFGGSSTTVHLHFNIRKNVSGVGVVFVSPYMSLVRSYETLIGAPPPMVDAGVPPPMVDARPMPPQPVDAMVTAPMAEGEVAGGCAVGGGWKWWGALLLGLGYAALRKRRIQ